MLPWRTIFFAVNFTFSISIAAISAIDLGAHLCSGGSALSLIVSVSLFVSGGTCAFGEWLLYDRNASRLEIYLGIVCAVIGALVLFAFGSMAHDALAKGDSSGIGFWVGFGTISLCISAYCFWCAWLRIRHRTIAMPQGFPVQPLKNKSDDLQKREAMEAGVAVER